MCPCWCFYLRDEQRTASFSLLMPFGYLSSEFPKLSLRFVPCLQGASTVLDLHPSFPPLLLAPYMPPGRCDEMFVPKPGTGTERHLHRRQVHSAAQTCCLKLSGVNKLCPLARIHQQRAPRYPNGEGSTQPGEQDIYRAQRDPTKEQKIKELKKKK